MTSTPAKPLQPTATLSKSTVGASLPVFLRAPSTPQVGRPPTTVMTPEQIVEKAKQVCEHYYVVCGYNYLFNSRMEIFPGGPCCAKNSRTSTRGTMVRKTATESSRATPSEITLGLPFRRNGLARGRLCSGT